MRKVARVLGFVMFTSVTFLFADPATQPTDWAKMVSDKLNVLATALKTSVEFLWSALVKQAYFEGTYALVVTLFLVTVATIAFRYFFKGLAWWNTENMTKERTQYGHWNDVQTAHFWLQGALPFVIGTVCTIAAFTWFADCYALFNPNYWALQKILETLGK